MNISVLLGVSVSLLSNWINYSIDRKPVDLDKSVFPSPDGNRIASFQQEDDRWYHLKVKDASTGRTDDSALAEYTPIFSVQWTRDSKSILTIGHIAHGSTATVFHLRDGKWKVQDITFPSIPDANSPDVYRVIAEVAKADANEHDFVVRYEFGIQTKAKDGSLQEVIYDEIDRVDPQTNKAVPLKRVRR